MQLSLCEAIATSSFSSACRSPRASSCTRSTSGAAAFQHVESAIGGATQAATPAAWVALRISPAYFASRCPFRAPFNAFDHAGETAPKTVKLFINNDHLAFDDVEDKKPHHEFELTAKDVGGGTIVLPFVKFQFVTNLTVSEATPALLQRPVPGPNPRSGPQLVALG